MSETMDRRDSDLRNLNDRVVKLETIVDFQQKALSDHKDQTDKQFEKLTERFDRMDGKIDKIVDSLTSDKVSIAKILGYGGAAILVVGGLITAAARALFGA